MNLRNFSHSKLFVGLFAGIGITVICLIIFQAGVHVGYKKAAYSFGFGDTYHAMFGTPKRSLPFGEPQGRFSNAHGTVGSIVKIELPTVIIEDRDQTEKIILLKDDTIIRKFRDTLTATDLTLGDSVVVMGAPNNQMQIEAKLIRVLPAQRQDDTRKRN